MCRRASRAVEGEPSRGTTMVVNMCFRAGPGQGRSWTRSCPQPIVLNSVESTALPDDAQKLRSHGVTKGCCFHIVSFRMQVPLSCILRSTMLYALMASGEQLYAQDFQGTQAGLCGGESHVLRCLLLLSSVFELRQHGTLLAYQSHDLFSFRGDRDNNQT